MWGCGLEECYSVFASLARGDIKFFLNSGLLDQEGNKIDLGDDSLDLGASTLSDNTGRVLLKEGSQLLQLGLIRDLGEVSASLLELEHDILNLTIDLDTTGRNTGEQVAEGDETDKTAVLGRDNGQLVESVALHQQDGLTAAGGVGDSDGSLEVKASNGGTAPLEVLGLLLRGHGLVSESVGLHPAVVQELGHVVTDRVGQQDNATLARSELLGGPNGSGDSGTGGSSAKNTLLADQTASHDEGLLVLALDPAVNQGAVQSLGDEVITDTLNLVTLSRGVQRLGLSENGTMGIDTNNLRNKKRGKKRD